MSPTSPSTAPHTALYRRWRAQTFGEMVGQTAVVETLRNAVRLDRAGHAYLFVGPRGTGKTSLARILAKAVNCTDLRDGDPCDACAACVAIRDGAALDVAEFDAASSNTVADMRELLPRVYTGPADLRRKVFIVDEVQRITQGWDVLLKTLEEPPPHVLFVFCTTDPAQIRPAVLSRVQRFTFRPLTVEQIAGKLRRILAELDRRVDPDAVELIAELAAGGMRDAESMLDQLLSSASDPLTAEEVRAQLGMADAAAVDAFLDALLRGDPLAGIHVLDALESDGRDLRHATDQSVQRLRSALVERLSGRGAGDPIAGHDVGALASAARRLAAIEPLPGAGGLRLQLELALLAGPVAGPLPAPSFAERGPVAPAAQSGPPASVHAPRDSSPAADSRRPEPPPPPRSGPPSRDAAPASVPPGRPPSGAVPPSPGGAPRDDVRDAVARDTPAVGGNEGGRETPGGAAVTDSQVPAGASAAASSTPDGTAEGDVPAIDRLRARWSDVVARVGANPAARPVIAACRPVSVEDRIVVLGFPEDQTFLREKAEQRRKALEDGVSAVLGAPYGVRCVSTNLEALPPLPVDDAQRTVLEQARRIFAGELGDAGEIE